MSSRVDAVEDDDAVYIDVQPGNRGYVDHWLDEEWPAAADAVGDPVYADAFASPTFREIAGGWYGFIVIGGTIVLVAALMIIVGALRAVF